MSEPERQFSGRNASVPSATEAGTTRARRHRSRHGSQHRLHRQDRLRRSQRNLALCTAGGLLIGAIIGALTHFSIPNIGAGAGIGLAIGLAFGILAAG